MTSNIKLNQGNYKAILCSISGGADSDVMLDMFERVKGDTPITYIFFDTGIEYEATKQHLCELEAKYGIEIKRMRPKKPVPLACREHGVPFLAKNISEFIARLQKHGFMWEDGSFEELSRKYHNCDSALRWWCNANGGGSQFNIDKKIGLKEFMMANPPWFSISKLCCQYAKKNLIHDIIRSYEKPLLNCNGVRKAEFGQRKYTYKNCFTPENDEGVANFRPLFFLTDADKKSYEELFGVTHSRCYTEYGLKRTGCAGCPFGSGFEHELEAIEEYEPKLYTAVNHIFGDSYEYTRMYRQFKEEFKKERKDGKQIHSGGFEDNAGVATGEEDTGHADADTGMD